MYPWRNEKYKLLWVLVSVYYFECRIAFLLEEATGGEWVSRLQCCEEVILRICACQCACVCARGATERKHMLFVRGVVLLSLLLFFSLSSLLFFLLFLPFFSFLCWLQLKKIAAFLLDGRLAVLSPGGGMLKP